MKKGIIFGIIFLVLISSVYAIPTINTATSSFGDEEQITISGSDFGSKDPVEPLIWDDGSASVPLNTHYDEWRPTSAEQGSHYNMNYRDANFVNSRSVGFPHNRMSYVLAGAHATAFDSGQAYSGASVALGKNTRSHNYFISYYYRVDPNFDAENNPQYNDNLKEITITDEENNFYPNDRIYSFGYVGWCGSDIPGVVYGPIRIGRNPIEPENQNLPYGCSGNNLVYHENPINDWIKINWEGNYNYQHDSPQISLTTYPSGARTNTSHYGGGITVGEYASWQYMGYPKLNDLRFIGIGGFGRVKRLNNGVNSWRYFADVYMDNTRARVMLGDNANYEDCTILEPQIPSTWNAGSITVTTNLGALQDGPAYLYVFDSDNGRNTNGYPVTLGSGGGPVCPDGNCEAGENCQADANSCTDNQCYEPICVNGCGQTLVSVRATDESCSGGNFCDGSGNCVECIDNNDCATQEVCNIDVCESGYHEADTVPPYGEIETGELTAYVDRWYHESTITIRDVVQVMRYWKAGSY